MTAVQRNNIANPATGLMVYVTSNDLFYYYDGSVWIPLAAQTGQPTTASMWGVQPVRENTQVIASDDGANDEFGISVSISEDYAIIGAPYDDSGGSDSGSAYIFKRNGNSWIQEAKLTANDADIGDRFGFSVHISGSYAIVGAHEDDDKGFNSGSAYIFQRSGITWSLMTKLTAFDGAVSDNFGYSVSISSSHAVIGANADDDDAGSAYVFVRNSNVWGLEDKLTANDRTSDDYFGQSVAISGLYLVIGSYRDDDAGSDSGSAYVFSRVNNAWSQQAKLLPSDGAPSDAFGYSVAISGNTAVIGTWRDDDTGIGSGSAYVFSRSGTNWTEHAKLIANDGRAFDRFGFSVGIDGDNIVIGASHEDYNGINSGSAYIYEGSGANWTQTAKLTANNGDVDDRFGRAVAVSGVYALIGAHFSDPVFTNSGSAYFFKKE